MPEFELNQSSCFALDPSIECQYLILLGPIISKYNIHPDSKSLIILT